MTPEENKKTARRIVIEIIAGNTDLIDQVFAANYVDHALPAGIPPTREGFKSMIPVLRTAFPDLEYTIEDQIAEGDRVAQRLRGRGTLKGEFMGMPPTGKTAEWEEMHIHRFDAEGKLIEHWDVTDEVGMMTQLGMGGA
jgi:predicted ester cyclase